MRSQLLPLGQEAATAGGHGADAMDLDGAGAGKQHLQPPHGLWHGHGPILLLLVAVHLAAFLYWCALQLLTGQQSSCW